MTTLEDRLAPKPPELTFEQAADLPVAGLTALQGLRDKAHVRPGRSVLIYGTGGGVGTFAVRIARRLGAYVTAVTGTGNVDLVWAILSRLIKAPLSSRTGAGASRRSWPG